MPNCVKCGNSYSLGCGQCARCTWPFSENAWASTSFRVKRITRDTSCINAKQADRALNQLESWEGAGLFQFQRSEAMLTELTGPDRVAKAKLTPSHPRVMRVGVSTIGGPDVLAGPDLGDELRTIMFPTSAILTTNQELDVEHLRLHVHTGGDLFVTRDGDFITQGRQEALRARGIWTLFPEGAVALLERLYGWGAA